LLTLGHKFTLKSVQELQRELVLCGQSLLSDNGLHGCGILSSSVFGVLFESISKTVSDLISFVASQAERTSWFETSP
jgi:hypothetical protein